MEWKATSGGFVTATVGRGGAIPEAMLRLWAHMRDVVLPAQPASSWNCVRVEFWSDTGRVIVFPASTRSEQRIETGGCVVQFDDLLDYYEALADSDVDDDTFRNALLAEENLWAGRLVDAGRKAGLAGLHVLFWNAADEQIGDAKLQ